MISDVLFDAIQEIERYQTEFPRSYAELAEWINEVKTAMEELQRHLDNPSARAIGPSRHEPDLPS